MNILMASSRGGGIDKLMKRETPLKGHIYPGGTLAFMTTRLSKALPPPHTSQTTPHVYILAGIPDITTRLKERSTHMYTESVYTGTPADTITTLKGEIDKIEGAVKDLGGIPI